MANPEAVKSLARGVAAWNEWRAHADAPPDLSHIEIRNADFRGGDFRRADFDGSAFENVDFRGADFRAARLNGIDATATSFEGARLEGAELKGSDFKRVCLRDANLRGAEAFELKIRHSNLVRASLRDARLRFVHIYNTDLGASDLDGVAAEHVVLKRVALEPERVAKHAGPGLVFELANEPTPAEWIPWDAFRVRNKGDEFGSIVHQGKAWWISDGRWDFFITHASPDKEAVARPLAAALEARDMRVWLDEGQLKIGDDLEEVIGFGTRASLFGVAVLSREFFGRRWTEAELRALSAKRIFVVLHGLDPAELEVLCPALRDKVSYPSTRGPEKIADELVEAIRTPPRVLHGGG